MKRGALFGPVVLCAFALSLAGCGDRASAPPPAESASEAPPTDEAPTDEAEAGDTDLPSTGPAESPAGHYELAPPAVEPEVSAPSEPVEPLHRAEGYGEWAHYPTTSEGGIYSPESGGGAQPGSGGASPEGATALPFPGSRSESPEIASNPGESTSPTTTQLVWNAWPEEKPTFRSSPSYEPLAILERGEDYRVWIDLAPLQYAIAGIASATASSETHEAIRADELDEVTFDLIVLPDPRFFLIDDGAETQLKLDLSSLKTGAPPIQAGHTLESRAKTKLGRAHFDLTTRQVEGIGSIDISVWVNGAPIDELIFSVCVGFPAGSSECRGTGVVSNGLKGVDSLRVSTGEGGVPDVGVHLIEVGTDKIQGVLKLASESHYRTWTVRHKVDELRRRLGLLTVQADEQIRYPDEEKLRDDGRRLFDLVFDEDENSAKRAGESLIGFLAPYSEANTDVYPSFFARVVRRGSGRQLFLPLSLLALPLAVPRPTAAADANVEAEPAPREAGPASLGGGQGLAATPPVAAPVAMRASQPIGMFARIEMPLPLQSYERYSTCLKRWIVVAPPSDTGDEAIGNALGSQGTFNDLSLETGDRVTTRDTLAERWRGTAPPSTWVVTSHHANDALRFPPNDLLHAGDVDEVTFGEPTLVILNGCDTVGSNTSDLVEQLNKRGVGTIIATTTTLPGFVAGRYLDCLATAIRDNQGRIAIWLAHRRALQCLKNRKDGKLVADADGKLVESGKPIGSRAATYQLLGNSSVEVCPEMTQATP